ncbi:homocysteine S-methyltransferase 2-like [Diospyros lotus]|uniref:homocysteine S-methyltransferase 2-like n=1 Tax=Diospyros lotus TaxID=55363 RepID=UPI0022580D87|nr:homocysteine S-methyltransferase 2-like [Diospyros lotus]
MGPSSYIYVIHEAFPPTGFAKHSTRLGAAEKLSYWFLAMGPGKGEMSSLMSDFLRQAGGVAVIDGGLATELERHGADLNDPLWSAKYLPASPDLIRKVHLDYLEAGADIIITASYQATIQGFKAKGFSQGESEALLRKSVDISCEARKMYHEKCNKFSGNDAGDNRILKHRSILVAASVGSYGAYLADGSEYSGDYGNAVTLKFLKDFHRRRVQVLADSGADLIAFETVPNKLEAQAYAQLLEEEDIKIPAWFSFNSKDGVHVVSGDSLLECASIAEECKKVVAVGINCTPPRFIHDLILSIKKVTSKPILIYPNSGESYDADKKQWVQNTGVSDEDFISYVGKWCDAGASLVGGCCRTTPNTIRAIYTTLSSRSAAVSLQ